MPLFLAILLKETIRLSLTDLQELLDVTHEKTINKCTIHFFKMKMACPIESTIVWKNPKGSQIKPYDFFVAHKTLQKIAKWNYPLIISDYLSTF